MSTPRTYRFGDASTPGVLLGLPPRQAVPVVAGVAWLAICLQTPLGLPGGAAGLVMACVAAFGRWRNAPLLETAAPAASLTLARCAGRARWHRPPLLGTANQRRIDRLPGALAGLELLDVPAPWGELNAAPMAVVRDRRRHTLTAVLPVRGKGFPLAAGPEQDGMLAGWGAALSPFAHERSPVVGIAWQAWTGPADAGPHHDFLAAAGVTDRAAGDEVVRDYLALVEQQAPVTRHHGVLVTVTVAERPVLSRARSRLEAAVDALSGELRAFRNRLEIAGLEVGPPLTPAGLTSALRLRSDPTRAAQVASMARSLAAAAGRGSMEWGPMTVEPAWAHVRVDGSWHRTYRIATWPQLPVPADWLAPLLAEPSATRTISVIMQPVPLARSARAADREAMAREADADSKGQRGFRITARERKRLAEVEARERELAEGHAEFRFAAIVDVTAPHEEGLDEAAAAVEQAAAQSLVDLRPLDARHDQGWVACLPLGRHVAGRGRQP